MKRLFVTIALLGAITATSEAVITIPNSKIASGSITGTMYVVDSPWDAPLSTGGPLGPDWTDDAADGYRINSGSGVDGGYQGNSPWQQDGSPIRSQIRVHSSGGSTYTFNLPDGAVINAIYGTWTTRGSSGATYSYSEGAQSDSFGRTHTSAPTNNLQLNWTDSGSGTQTATFERLFNSAITVEGGNGFVLNAVRTGNTHQSDAIVLDVTIVPEPSSLCLLGLGAFMLTLRRRRS